MRSLTLRQMRIFVAVGEQENLAAAGRTLGLSAATLSDALRDVEAMLGKAMFDRPGRRLRLSPAGKALLPDAKKILRDMDAMMQRHGRLPILRIGASVTVGNYILPPMLSDFSIRHPDIEIVVQIRNTDDIVRLLLEHEIEAAIIEGRVAHPDLTVLVWRHDPLVIIAAPDHPLAEMNDIAALADAHWILREHGSGTRQSFDAAAAEWSSPPRVLLTVGGNELLKTAVIRGVGLGCISKSAVLSEIQRGELVLVPIQNTLIERTLRIVHRVEKAPEGNLRAFLSECMNSKASE